MQSIRSKIVERTRTPTQGSRTTPSVLPPTSFKAQGQVAGGPASSTGGGSVPLPRVGPSSPSGAKSAEAVALVAAASPSGTFASSSLAVTTAGSGPTEDGFTRHEQALAAEVNLLRRDPRAYADRLAQRMLLQEPFVAHKKMAFPELQAFAAAKAEEQSALRGRLEAAAAKRLEEVTALQAQWAIEDVERAKRAKKGAAAANKRRGSGAGNEEADIGEERAAIVGRIDAAFNALRAETTATLDRVSEQLRKATAGVKAIEACVHRVAATPPQPELVVSRGLSLAARDACEVGQSALTQPATWAQRYGRGTRFGAALFVGDETPEQTVMEMLLGLQDPQLLGRAALLDRAYDTIGSGWRAARNTADTHSTLILSRHFEELRAISDRHHLPLTQLKHELPNAVKESPGVAVCLQGSSGIEIIEPRFHPHRCGNSARLRFKVPPRVHLCSVLTHAAETEPQFPLTGDGRSFSHHLDEGTLEIVVVLPYRGEFALTLFAHQAGAGPHGHAAGGSGDDAAPGGGGGGGGYTRVGKVLLNAHDWAPCQSGGSLPVSTGDFAKRHCRLVGPMGGVLPPGTVQRFEVTVPISGYLRDELAQVEGELGAIEAKQLHSEATLDELSGAAAEAQAKWAEVEAASTQRIQAITEELTAVTKDVSRKRGKELERVKTLQAELEEQRRGHEATLVATQRALQEATARLDTFRRSARQVTAHQKRLTRERERLHEAMDRSNPLLIEVSVGDRRAVAAPVDGDLTRYAVSLRVPTSGNVCMYINGLLELTWTVGAE